MRVDVCENICLLFLFLRTKENFIMLEQENKKQLKKVTYQTHGTCSKYICISVDEYGEVKDAQFIGGCDGNTKGVCALIRDMKAKEVIARLKGITCGNKPTSCPDQLATALEEMGY